MNYVCSNCHTLIANQESQIQRLGQQKITFLIFKDIRNYIVIENHPSLAEINCELCDTQIGLKILNDYALYQSAIMMPPTDISIGIFSLKSELLDLLEIQNCRIRKQQIFKRELQDYHCNGSINGAIIIHQLEARILLLGDNGLYNDLFKTLYEHTLGNVILVLYTQTTTNRDFLQNLAEQGMQPELLQLRSNHKLFFYPEQIPTQDFSYKNHPHIFPLEFKSGVINSEDKEQLLLFYLDRVRNVDKALQRQIIHEYKQLQNNCILF